MTSRLLQHLGLRRPLAPLPRAQCRGGAARAAGAAARRAQRWPWSATPARPRSPTRLQAGARGAGPGQRRLSDPGPVGGAGRAGGLGPADRPVPVPGLPAAAQRRAAARAGGAGGVPATLVLFESPQRLAEMLADAAAVLGPRPAAVARELTKLLRGASPRHAARARRRLCGDRPAQGRGRGGDRPAGGRRRRARRRGGRPAAARGTRRREAAPRRGRRSPPPPAAAPTSSTAARWRSRADRRREPPAAASAPAASPRAAAAWLLRLRGYRILARRYTTPVGEIDLVARRGDSGLRRGQAARPAADAALPSLPRQQARIARAAARLPAAAAAACRLRGPLRSGGGGALAAAAPRRRRLARLSAITSQAGMAQQLPGQGRQGQLANVRRHPEPPAASAVVAAAQDGHGQVEVGEQVAHLARHGLQARRRRERRRGSAGGRRVGSHGVEGSSIMPPSRPSRAAAGTARRRPAAPGGRPWRTRRRASSRALGG